MRRLDILRSDKIGTPAPQLPPRRTGRRAIALPLLSRAQAFLRNACLLFAIASGIGIIQMWLVLKHFNNKAPVEPAMQTRRQFIGQTSAAVGGIGLGLALAPHVFARNGAASDRVAFGLIGCGGMGRADLQQFMRLKEIGRAHV